MKPIEITKIEGVELSITSDAETKKASLLAASQGISVVTDAFEYEAAVDATKEIKTYLKAVEEARKEVKKPVDDLARRIQETAKEHTAELESALSRLGTLVISFEDAEQRKREEVERQARIEQERIAREAAAKEAERIKAESQGRTGELLPDLNEIRDEAARKASEVKQWAANEATPKAKGLRRTTVTKFEITDEAALLAARPDLFSPDERKIRAALKITKNIPGLKVWEDTKI